MTREELIANLEHLAEYVKYSEDAPALREVIEMLKCSEMPNSSKDFFWKNARKNARKYTETHACDLIQPDHIAEVGKKVDSDVISRQAAIDELTEYGSGNDIYMSVGELKKTDRSTATRTTRP